MTHNSVLVRVHLAVMIGPALVGAKKSIGRATNPSGIRVALFHPQQPLLGKVPPGPLGEAHLRHKVHDVAFMLRALRTVVKDQRPDVPKGGQEPLTKRFPAVRVPEDRKVRRYCRHDFVSCVIYLSRVARNLGLSTENDRPTRQQGRRKGMCFKESRRLRIFCNIRHKRTTTMKKETKKSISSLLKESNKRMRTGRPSIGERMKIVKPAPRRASRYHSYAIAMAAKVASRVTDAIKYIKDAVAKKLGIKRQQKNVLTSIRKSSFANNLELYIQTVTAMQYMCWYTMHGVPYLAHLLQCDSSDPKRTRPDGDCRANDYSDPFGCALYSFCPNPCCSSLREPSQENCWNRFNNPCRLHGLKGGRGCKVSRELNLHYHRLVDQGIQISCDCGTGRRYEPVAGMCVWQDQCADPNACPKPHQHCFNLYGGYACRCDPDYRWREYDKSCVPIYIPQKEEEKKEKGKEKKEKKEEEEEKKEEMENEEEEEEENKDEEEMEEEEGQEGKEKEAPFFRWLHELVDTSLKVSPTPKENYNWSLV